jgi:hypothetical protein
MADAEIVSAHRLLQKQKSLTKTESLQTRKSTLEASSPGYGEIFFTHRLLPNQKSLTKTESLHTRKSTPELVLRLTLKSSAHIDYCRLRNHWRKLSRCRPGNKHRKPVLQVTVKSSLHIDYCRIRNHWQKLSRRTPGNQHRKLVL